MQTKVIFTCFAGRRGNLEVLLAYTDALYKKELLYEFHMWNFTRNGDDEAWIKECFDKKINPEHPYVKLFHPDKSAGWRDYYKHYTQQAYPNHVIVKCDDDILYIDVEGFKGFIERRLENKDNLLAFGSIVNNGVCAHIQQLDGLIPDTISHFPYDICCGLLWENGVLAQRLHEYFIANHKSWISRTRELIPGRFIQPIGHRISINFFAILSKDLDIYQQIGYDDELDLSINMPHHHNRHNYVDKGFTVAHLSFYKQRETQLDEPYLQKKYKELAKTIL